MYVCELNRGGSCHRGRSLRGWKDNVKELLVERKDWNKQGKGVCTGRRGGSNAMATPVEGCFRREQGMRDE